MLSIGRLARALSNPLMHRPLLFKNQFAHTNDGDIFPRQHNFYWPKEKRKILFGDTIKPQVEGQYHDVLMLPGQDGGEIGMLINEIIERDVPISAENVCMLIHQFIENHMMTKEVFDKIEKHAYRHKGEYKIRSIFGGLRGAILYNRQKLINFFLQEYVAHAHKFTIYQMFDTICTISHAKYLDLEQKKLIFENYFRADFIDALKAIDGARIALLAKTVDSFMELDDYEEQLWEPLIAAMDNKKGWGRLTILEKLYPISGTFDSAKKLFDKYYEELSSDDKVLRKYNLEELRYYTPLELIKFSQQNPSDYYPRIRSLLDQDEDPDECNTLYDEYLESGSVKEEAEIIKDKSMSFGYAIKDRYEMLKEDNTDMSVLTKEEFQQLFGNYDEAMDILKSSPQEEGIQDEHEEGEEGEEEPEE